MDHQGSPNKLVFIHHPPVNPVYLFCPPPLSFPPGNTTLFSVVVGGLVAQSCLFANSWTVACQAPLSMIFSRQEYWTVLPFHSTGDLPDVGIELLSHALQADVICFVLV